MASRKDWCTYVVLKAEVNRATVEQTNEFIAGIRAHLDTIADIHARLDRRLATTAVTPSFSSTCARGVPRR